MRPFLIALAAAALVGTAAHAENDVPSKEQMAKVESTLKAAGYSKWEKVEIDNGNYEVDDAIDASGKTFDLRIDGKTMKITSKLAD